MKQHAIVFSTHGAGSNLNHLVKEAKDRGQTITEKGKIFAFTPSEAAQHAFKPQVRKDAYGLAKTETALPSSFNDILNAVDMGEM